jgi:hypothetical protein
MVAYSFKGRFVDPIRVGLSQVSLSFDCRPKRQTIRAIGKRRHARPGETLQLYCGMRSPQCFKIGDARCTEVLPIRIVVGKHTLPTELAGKHIGGGHLHDFARADGFEHGEDMHAFWLDEHGLGEFKGVLIRWEPL